MDERRLRVASVGCLLIAFTPLLMWLLASSSSRVYRSWLEAPSAMRVTVPIALGAAALAFASHGLWLQRQGIGELRDRLAEIEADPRDRLGTVPLVGVASAAPVLGAPMTAAAPSIQGGTMTVVEDDGSEASGDPSAGGKAQAAAIAAAKKQGSRATKKAQRKAKSVAKSKARKMFRDAF